MAGWADAPILRPPQRAAERHPRSLLFRPRRPRHAALRGGESGPGRRGEMAAAHRPDHRPGGPPDRPRGHPSAGAHTQPEWPAPRRRRQLERRAHFRPRHRPGTLAHDHARRCETRRAAQARRTPGGCEHARARRHAHRKKGRAHRRQRRTQAGQGRQDVLRRARLFARRHAALCLQPQRADSLFRRGTHGETETRRELHSAQCQRAETPRGHRHGHRRLGGWNQTLRLREPRQPPARTRCRHRQTAAPVEHRHRPAQRGARGRQSLRLLPRRPASESRRPHGERRARRARPRGRTLNRERGLGGHHRPRRE